MTEATAEKPAETAAPAAAAPAAESKEVDTSKLTATAKKVLEQVEGMSILELAELVKVMEDKFGVAAAPVAVAAAPGAAGADGGAATASSTATVVLKDGGAQKIAVIKAVREATGLGLKEAKDLVDGAPKTVKENLKRPEAEELKKKLEAAGATVELK